LVKKVGVGDTGFIQWLWFITMVWTLVIAGSLTWNISQLDQHMDEEAKTNAKVLFEQNLMFRRWNSMHGGVYVPVTEKTLPNPYLSHVPDRDVTTTSGKKLTMINPAYMVRQTHELMVEAGSGIQGHITSLNPIRPENAPDPWELMILKRFEAGEGESFSREKMADGKEYFRYMRPMVVEQNCLKCHAHQGYQLGDIRGGISVSIDSAFHVAEVANSKITLIEGHGIIWLLGLAGLFVSGRRQHRLEKDSIRNEERLQLALSSASQAWFDLDVASGKAEVSPEYPPLIGYTPKEFHASLQDWMDHIHPNDIDAVKKAFQTCLASDKPVEMEYRRQSKSGDWVWLSSVGKVVKRDENNNPIRVTGIHMDVTERKLADAKVAESEKRFRNTFEQAAVGVAHVGIDGSWLKVNRRLCDMLGYSHEELLTKTFQDITHPADLEANLHYVEQVLNGEIECYDMEKRYFRKDGEIIWTNLTVSLVLKEDDSPDYFISVVEDISDRKEAEEALKTSERSLRQAQATGHLGNWSLNADEAMRWSDECFRIFDVSPEFDITLEHFIKLIHPDDRPAVQGWIAHAFDARRPGAIVFRHVREDGSIKHINGEVELICDEQESVDHLEGTFQDITDRLLLEEQFHQAQKMEALGTLVGGIAHDFNNILAGMTGNIYLAKRQTEMIPDATEKLETTEKLAFRAAELIKQLLTFARKDRIQIKSIPFVQFTKETTKFLRASLPENIEFHVVVGSDPAIIMGDATQLHQVLMNLVNNARDAVESQEKPFIKIALKTVHVDDQFLMAHPEAKADAYAHLSVEDNGCGIPPSDLEHVFEPFFTSKEVDKGTGLGLSMVFGAIQTHQGFVEVDSIVGKGSQFHVYLPVQDLDDVVQSSTSEITIERGENEMVLLVDDEKDVTDSSAEVLKSLGYRVTVAYDGKEATEIYSEQSSEIDVVIMDVVMPKMSGAKAVERIREINPDAKVIFCTGYDKTHALPKGLESESDDVLSKPCDIEMLSSVLRRKINS